MDLRDIIAALQGGMNPDQAMLKASVPPNMQPAINEGGADQYVPQAEPPVKAPVMANYGANTPPQAPPQAPPQLPPIPTAPQGARTPVTNPQQPTEAPKITQSPPDLANMYVALMEKNQNARALDSGMSLIAAGLSNRPETRQALIQRSAGVGGGAGGMSLSASDMINFQKQATDQQNQAMVRSLLPALQRQYKMTPAQIQALQATGKLDEVLKHYATENLVQVTDAATGQTHMVTPREGQIKATLGGEKPAKTSWVDGPQGKELRSDETGQLVGPSGIGLPPDKILVKRPDGSQVLVDKTTTTGEVAPAEKVGDVIPPSEQELFAINKAREGRGEKPLTAEELIKLKQTPPTNINVGTDGSMFPAPEKGYDYERGTDGKVLVDPATHRPKLYKVEGGSPESEAKELAEKKAKDAAKEATGQRLKAASTSGVVMSAREALKIIEDPSNILPVAGLATSVGKAFGGTGATNLGVQLAEINSRTALAQLKSMRESSVSGASGLGQVTDFEQRMLSSATANLDQYQSIPQLKQQLRKVQAAMLVMAENSFDEKDVEAYEKALNAKLKEIEGEVKTKQGAVRRRQ